MSHSTFSAESEANLRRARIEAKWHRRRYVRDFGDYSTPLNLVHDIRMTAWLFEKIRIEGPSLSEQRLQVMRAQLLRKLATAELVAIDLLGDPFPASKGNS